MLLSFLPFTSCVVSFQILSTKEPIGSCVGFSNIIFVVIASSVANFIFHSKRYNIHIWCVTKQFVPIWQKQTFIVYNSGNFWVFQEGKNPEFLWTAFKVFFALKTFFYCFSFEMVGFLLLFHLQNIPASDQSIFY